MYTSATQDLENEYVEILESGAVPRDRIMIDRRVFGRTHNFEAVNCPRQQARCRLPCRSSDSRILTYSFSRSCAADVYTEWFSSIVSGCSPSEAWQGRPCHTRRAYKFSGILAATPAPLKVSVVKCDIHRSVEYAQSDFNTAV